MTDKDPVQKIMDRTFADLAALFAEETGQAAAVCTNWFLVAEWSTVGSDEAARWISRWFDDRHPEWYRFALLDYARNGNWSDATKGPIP